MKPPPSYVSVSGDVVVFKFPWEEYDNLAFCPLQSHGTTTLKNFTHFFSNQPPDENGHVLQFSMAMQNFGMTSTLTEQGWFVPFIVGSSFIPSGRSLHWLTWHHTAALVKAGPAFVMCFFLVGGWTNPIEKYKSNWNISPGRGDN